MQVGIVKLGNFTLFMAFSEEAEPEHTFMVKSGEQTDLTPDVQTMLNMGATGQPVFQNIPTEP